MADNVRLRVLHVNKFVYRRGGAEAYMLDLAAQQRAAGHVVDFFGMDHAENESVTFGDDFATEVRLNPAPIKTSDRAVVAAKVIWNRDAARSIGRVVDRFEPDVAHLHNVYHQLSPSVIRALDARGIPIVLTMHDYKLTCPAYNALRDGGPCFDCAGGRNQNAVRNRCGGSLVESALLAVESTAHRMANAYGGVDVFHCPSRYLLNRMTDAGVYPDRLRHLPLPAEQVLDRPAPVAGNHAVYVGRLSDEKGPQVLVEAMGRCPGRQLVVVGDGPDRAALESLAARVAPGQVTFVGRVARGDVGDLIRAGGFVVVPSICSENQPLSVLEAHGIGRAVVGSDLGGIAELVDDGATGLLFRPGDPVAMAEAMNRLFADPDQAATLGSNGWRRVSTEATVDLHLRGLDALYAEAGARPQSTVEPLSHV